MRILEPLFKKQTNGTFVALRSHARNAIVAYRKFPQNTPPGTISHWIKEKEQEYLMMA